MQYLELVKSSRADNFHGIKVFRRWKHYSLYLPPYMANAWSKKNFCLSKSSNFDLSKHSLGANANSCEDNIYIYIYKEHEL